VFGVPVRDPLTFTGVTAALAGVALAACAILRFQSVSKRCVV
jgi:hypothetical protein